MKIFLQISRNWKTETLQNVKSLKLWVFKPRNAERI